VAPAPAPEIELEAAPPAEIQIPFADRLPRTGEEAAGPVRAVVFGLTLLAVFGVVRHGRRRGEDEG